MKLTFTVVIVLLLFMLLKYEMRSQCLCSPTYANPFTVLIDSCTSTSSSDTSCNWRWTHFDFTYRYKLFSKEGCLVSVDTLNARDMFKVPIDSLRTNLSWRSIDTNLSYLRNECMLLEQTFGEYYFTPYSPGRRGNGERDTITTLYQDTSGSIRVVFRYLKFMNYVNVDSVNDYLVNTSHIKGNFDVVYRELTSVANQITQNEPPYILYPCSSSMIVKTVLKNALENGRHISILDVQGRNLSNLANIETFDSYVQIDISSFSNGVYFIVVGSQCLPFLVCH